MEFPPNRLNQADDSCRNHEFSGGVTFGYRI